MPATSTSAPTARADEADLARALERAGARLTEPRRRVLREIARRTGHFTAADLLAGTAVEETAAGRATVFRTLELVTALGLVERLDLPSGEHAYVRCEPTHHHHAICSRCGRSTEVDDCGIAAVAAEVARRTGYRIDRHRLELFGVCPECARTERFA